MREQIPNNLVIFWSNSPKIRIGYQNYESFDQPKWHENILNERIRQFFEPN